MIVTALIGHAAGMAAIHAQSFACKERWSATEFATLLGQPGTFGRIDEAGEGFALARVAADQAEILTIAVVAQRRRHGLGGRLLMAVEAEATRRGVRDMYLEVAADNSPAARLYAAAYYIEVGRRPSYYASGRDALVLRKSLA